MVVISMHHCDCLILFCLFLFFVSLVILLLHIMFYHCNSFVIYICANATGTNEINILTYRSLKNRSVHTKVIFCFMMIYVLPPKKAIMQNVYQENPEQIIINYLDK